MASINRDFIVLLISRSLRWIGGGINNQRMTAYKLAKAESSRHTVSVECN